MFHRPLQQPHGTALLLGQFLLSARGIVKRCSAGAGNTGAQQTPRRNRVLARGGGHIIPRSLRWSVLPEPEPALRRVTAAESEPPPSRRPAAIGDRVRCAAPARRRCGSGCRGLWRFPPSWNQWCNTWVTDRRACVDLLLMCSFFAKQRTEGLSVFFSRSENAYLPSSSPLNFLLVLWALRGVKDICLPERVAEVWLRLGFWKVNLQTVSQKAIKTPLVRYNYKLSGIKAVFHLHQY